MLSIGQGRGCPTRQTLFLEVERDVSGIERVPNDDGRSLQPTEVRGSFDGSLDGAFEVAEPALGACDVPHRSDA